MTRAKRRVYCAGPLFNDKEREEMAALADALGAKFDTFLPQRDGLELAPYTDLLVDRGIPLHHATDILSKAIFALDVFQVLDDCHGLVINLNGRVPDEGAVSEAAMAWCAGKAVVGYKTDVRSSLMGQDNPLVTGLMDFRVCRSLAETVEAMSEAFESVSAQGSLRKKRRRELTQYLKLGKEIWATLRQSDEVSPLIDLLVRSCEETDASHPRTEPKTAAC